MTCTQVDAVAVEREETPRSPEELSRLMKSAHDSGTTMIPIGGGTLLNLGNTPRSAQLGILTGGLRGIVEYEPDNMTVSALAGTTLQELQNTLQTGKQFLPLDPPRPELATLGGIVAANASGPIRFRYGTIRDMLIGVKIVHADGTPTKAGGKLVKNVTGYDMCKLYTGSLGTLGILTELTFKVQPQPETMTTALLAYSSLRAALAATQLYMKSDLQPDAMEAWNETACGSLAAFQIEGGHPWTLMMRFADIEPAVRWQVDRLQEKAADTGGTILRILPDEESRHFWRQAASARQPTVLSEEALVKCCVLYQSTAAAAQNMEDVGQRLGARTSLFCHAGTSVIYGLYQWENTVPSAEEMRCAFLGLRRQCVAAGGHAVIERVRPEVKNGLDVWGYEAPALEIMKRIKKEFDPQGLLNPGRFVGGI